MYFIYISCSSERNEGNVVVFVLTTIHYENKSMLGIVTILTPQKENYFIFDFVKKFQNSKVIPSLSYSTEKLN